MKSRDIVEGNVAKIAALFPQCVTECRDMPLACGTEFDSNQADCTSQSDVPTDYICRRQVRTRYKIDWEKLRAELDPDLIQEGEERYQFTWPDKRAASRLANEPTDKALRPIVEDSVDFWNTQNLYIEGDNLDVLKVLRENYLGKVKMIYIDPPYNTGNDFVYNDDFTESYDGYLESCKVYDANGNLQFDPKANNESNGRFHTDWLNMIYPRIKVAFDLLSKDGAIFISVDDHEVENMKKICNELFGEKNFVASVIWQRTYAPISLKKFFSENHDFCLIYAKDLSLFDMNLLPRSDKQNKDYKNPDNDPRGPWKVGNLTVGPAVEKQIFEITGPTGRTFLPPSGYCWRFTKEKFEQMRSDNRIWFGADGNNSPVPKLFLSEVQNGVTPMTIWTFDEVGHGQEATRELRDLMNSAVFTSPKPLRYITRFLQIGTSKDSIVLDFFSGSATTAHAVMKLNAEDGGHRKFIMVQLPEITDEKSEARKAGYANICEIGKERIRRAGKQICRDMPSACGTEFDGNQADYTSQSDVPTLDIGFRVLKLDSSNMEDVFYTPEDFDAKDIFTTVDNVKPGRTPLDLLFQVMPELNIELSAKIEEKEVNGKKVFFVDGTYLIATFDMNVNESTVTEIAKMRPAYFVMRDASAANDNVLDNFEQIFRHYSPQTIRKIL